MQSVSNFILTSRMDSQSALELTADLLLTPAKLLFGGKNILVFPNNTMLISSLNKSSISPLTEAAIKIVALVLLPFTVLGALIKLPCLKDPHLRALCSKKIPQQSTCDSKLTEMFFHICKSDRLASSNTKLAENYILQRLAAMSNLDKNQPIHLLVKGKEGIVSQGLRNDFTILEKLIFAGFKDIKVDYVVPTSADSSTVSLLKNKFNTCHPFQVAKVDVDTHMSEETIIPKQAQSNTHITIDYNTAVSSVGQFGSRRL